jgi:hypothetical protein
MGDFVSTYRSSRHLSMFVKIRNFQIPASIFGSKSFSIILRKRLTVNGIGLLRMMVCFWPMHRLKMKLFCQCYKKYRL